LNNEEDKCPLVHGPRINNGCPYIDTDKDGVSDVTHRWPYRPRTSQNTGCLVVDKLLNRRVDGAAKTLFRY
jgi:OOP family OmpA-OmpF porin